MQQHRHFKEQRLTPSTAKNLMVWYWIGTALLDRNRRLLTLIPQHLTILGDTCSLVGEYAFLNTLDLEAVYALDLKRFFVTRGVYPNDLIDSLTANIDTWSRFRWRHHRQGERQALHAPHT
jgi:hypothetical protein